MTPRQKDIAWALGAIVLFVAYFVMLVNLEFNIWMIIAMTIIGIWSTYEGGRVIFDRGYLPRIQKERQERLARNDLHEFQDRVSEQNQWTLQITPHWWASKMFVAGIGMVIIVSGSIYHFFTWTPFALNGAGNNVTFSCSDHKKIFASYFKSGKVFLEVNDNFTHINVYQNMLVTSGAGAFSADKSARFWSEDDEQLSTFLELDGSIKYRCKYLRSQE